MRNIYLIISTISTGLALSKSGVCEATHTRAYLLSYKEATSAAAVETKESEVSTLNRPFNILHIYATRFIELRPIETVTGQGKASPIGTVNDLALVTDTSFQRHLENLANQKNQDAFRELASNLEKTYTSYNKGSEGMAKGAARGVGAMILSTAATGILLTPVGASIAAAGAAAGTAVGAGAAAGGTIASSAFTSLAGVGGSVLTSMTLVPVIENRFFKEKRNLEFKRVVGEFNEQIGSTAEARFDVEKAYAEYSKSGWPFLKSSLAKLGLKPVERVYLAYSTNQQEAYTDAVKLCREKLSSLRLQDTAIDFDAALEEICAPTKLPIPDSENEHHSKAHHLLNHLGARDRVRGSINIGIDISNDLENQPLIFGRQNPGRFLGGRLFSGLLYPFGHLLFESWNEPLSSARYESLLASLRMKLGSSYVPSGFSIDEYVRRHRFNNNSFIESQWDQPHLRAYLNSLLNGTTGKNEPVDLQPIDDLIIYLKEGGELVEYLGNTYGSEVLYEIFRTFTELPKSEFFHFLQHIKYLEHYPSGRLAYFIKRMKQTYHSRFEEIVRRNVAVSGKFSDFCRSIGADDHEAMFEESIPAICEEAFREVIVEKSAPSISESVINILKL